MAEEEIRAVLVRYCRGIDRCDEDLIRSAYHADSYDDHGVYKGNGQEFADFIVPLMQKTYESTMHAIHNCTIEVDGDVAHAETYCVAYDVRPDDDGTRWFEQFGCRYVDRFERRDGEWRIAKRTVVHDWDIAQPIQAGFGEMVSMFERGRQDRTDVSYQR